MKNLFIFRAFFHAPRLKLAFSLVEMLMALLVASLLLAALAPVITRRVNENMHITGSFSHEGKSKTVEIAYRDPQYCPNVVYDDNGNELYCEGEYTVPEGFQNITVTAIGAGGGGGTAPAAGYIEYTQAGSTNTFTVPLMTDKLEATLISGGAGGGAGGQVIKTQTFVTSGNGGIANKTDNDTITVSSTGMGSWTIPDVIKNSNVLATACGGGGGGSSSVGDYVRHSGSIVASRAGYGGGSGGYVKNKILNFGTSSSLTYLLGGGGGGGGGSWTGGTANGQAYGGGGGGGGGKGHKPNGGDGFLWSDINTGMPGDGLPLSSMAGSGGIGNWNNKFLEKIDGGITVRTMGANGGTQGGGAGGIMHWGGCYVGGGGGGGGATQITIGTGNYLNIPGGGGGSGTFNITTNHTSCPPDASGGGGGGGGIGGGEGGGMSSPNGKKGTGGADANGMAGGKPSTVFGNNYCAGGDGSTQTEAVKGNVGENGKSGAIRLTYLDYGSGASGGGSGQLVPIQPIDVISGETLKVEIGTGLLGGIAGKVETNGVIANPTSGSTLSGGLQLISAIKRKDKYLLVSDSKLYPGNESTTSGGSGPCGGVPTGIVLGAPNCKGERGYISNGRNYVYANTDYDSFVSRYNNQFLTGHGKTAGNTTFVGNATYANNTIGGDGGIVTTPWFTCTPGKGGTASNPKGGDASGFGCGGGGGYGLADGGKGSGGYARLSWNMFWDTAKNAYVSKTSGSGGGGASGNIIKETIRAKEGQVIRIRIGAGGHGAKILNNSVVEAAAGGDTIFGSPEFIQIKAGGGGGGKSPAIKDGKLQKGAGGTVSALCHVGSRDLHKNSNYCTIGTAGGVSPDNDEGIANGGRGSAFSYKLNDKTYVGKAGTGGISSTQYNNAKGQDAEGIGAGGGGAALFTQNKVNSLGDLNYPQGGNGAPGRIILQLWE